MFVRCWGSRGSIPVSGREYLTYGGDTACMEIRSRGGETMIVDAGTGIRRLGRELLGARSRKIDILFTHAHWDHIIGFPFFAPLYARGYTLSIRGPSYGKPTYRDVLTGILRCPYFPITIEDKSIRARLIFKKMDTTRFTTAGISVTPVPLSHPKKGGYGFRFEENGKSFVFLTDNELGFVHNGGLSFEKYVEFCRGADLLIHDAEYTKNDYKNNRSWGHSLFTDTVQLGIKAGVSRLGLYHLNSKRTDEQVDEMVRQAREIIIRKGSSLECFAVGSNFEANL